MHSKFQLTDPNKSAFVEFKSKQRSSLNQEISHNIKFNSNFNTKQVLRFESKGSLNVHSPTTERLDFIRQLKTNSSLQNFKKKMFQISLITNNYDETLDIG